MERITGQTGRARGLPRAASRRRTPTRSFACPDDLWAEISRFAERRAVQRSDALRMLLADGLRAASRAEELDEAREWQVTQACAEARRIAGGDRSGVGWKVIDERFDRARDRIREREEHEAAAR
jgi:hypothetical protein